MNQSIMKVRWDPQYADEETQEFKKKLELKQIKRQIEILSTFLPDSILHLNKLEREQESVFTGVVLMIDIAGCSKLCEKYNKNDGGGIHRLTNTLNAYFGAIIEAVYLFGGDVIHYTFSGYQCVWRAQMGESLHEVIHNVIVCAVCIRDTLGNFQTEVNAKLYTKMTISCGHLRLVISGNDFYKTYLLIGTPVTELKKYHAKDGMVLIGPSAWGHVEEDAYEFEFLNTGFVQLIKYQDKSPAVRLANTKKLEEAAFMCGKHLEHRETLHKLRKFNDTLTDFKITENFMQDLPPRNSVANAAHNWTTNELKPYVISPISHQVEEKLAVDYLTELRQISILQIHIKPVSNRDDVLIECINQSNEAISKYVSEYLGHIIGVNLYSDYIGTIASFGLRGVKHELESRNALRAANKIMNALRGINNILKTSISVTIDYIYCGVLGHPHRRDYCLIGNIIKKCWNYLVASPEQIVCDLLTFKNAKLSSSYFTMVQSISEKLKQTMFKYQEFTDYQRYNITEKNSILGRSSILEFINLLIHQPHKVSHFSGLCLKGPHDIGISKIIKSALNLYSEADYTIAAVELIGKQRPYYTVSIIYNQIYNKYAEAESSNISIIKNMPRDLWNFNEILQQDGKRNLKLYSERKYKILNLFKAICKGDSTLITLIFIDNVQFIDNKSFDVLHVAMEEKVVRVICGGCFEQAHWDTLWKFSLSNQIKIMDVPPLQEQYVAPFLCQILNVKGISKKIVSLIIESCDGKPGYMEKSTLRLLNSYSIEIKHILPEETMDLNEVIIPDDLYSDTSEDTLIKDNQKIRSRILTIGIFKDNEIRIDSLNLDAITYEEYSTFTPYQQLVIRSASVLGDSFSRLLLIVVLKHPHEQLFANTIKVLFEENVFDCGTKYINATALEIKPLICHCYEYAMDFEQTFGLPKYSFCKFIYFKNKTLRSFAFGLLPPHHRKELHLKATEVLEKQTNLCPYCLEDNSGTILILRKFDDLAEACNTKDVPRHDFTNTENELTDDYLKQWIREAVINNRGNLENMIITKRRVWDSTACYCLEILTKVYADLVYHSKSAEHLGRIIFFLIQYSIVLVLMEDFENCIPLLTEASELCMFNSKMQYLTKEFRRSCLAKTHMLLAEAHLNMGNNTIAKNHICISLRQFNLPMLSMLYRGANNIMTTSYMSQSNREIIMSKLIAFIKADFSMCMNLVGIILFKKGYYKAAKRAVVKSLSFARSFHTNISFLCEVYSTALELYSFCGDTHVCEQLESNINMEILKYYTNNSTFELIGICKLLFFIFQFRALNSDILETIKFGYRTIEMNLLCQCYQNLMDMLPILCSLLLLSKRIHDAVQLAIMLCGYSTKYNQWAFIGYFAFCLELGLECSLYLEPVEKVIKFATIYYLEQGKMVRSNIDNKLILLVVNYYARNSQLSFISKWMILHDADQDGVFSSISVTNLLKRYENTLIIIVMCYRYQYPNRQTYEDHAKKLSKECSIAANKWKVFKPRYLHLKAYHQLILRGKRTSRCTMRKALREARKQHNILEQSWIIQNQAAWKFNYSSELTETKQYSWTLSSHYSPLHWSQIMYALPMY